MGRKPKQQITTDQSKPSTKSNPIKRGRKPKGVLEVDAKHKPIKPVKKVKTEEEIKHDRAIEYAFISKKMFLTKAESNREQWLKIQELFPEFDDVKFKAKYKIKHLVDLSIYDQCCNISRHIKFLTNLNDVIGYKQKKEKYDLVELNSIIFNIFSETIY